VGKHGKVNNKGQMVVRTLTALAILGDATQIEMILFESFAQGGQGKLGDIQ
jgi:hypothetical protein